MVLKITTNESQIQDSLWRIRNKACLPFEVSDSCVFLNLLQLTCAKSHRPAADCPRMCGAPEPCRPPEMFWNFNFTRPGVAWRRTRMSVSAQELKILFVFPAVGHVTMRDEGEGEEILRLGRCSGRWTWTCQWLGG